jgi:hypothetical protein
MLSDDRPPAHRTCTHTTHQMCKASESPQRSKQGSASTHPESTALKSQLIPIVGGTPLPKEDITDVEQPKQSFTTALASFALTMGPAEMETPLFNI